MLAPFDDPHSVPPSPRLPNQLIDITFACMTLEVHKRSSDVRRMFHTPIGWWYGIATLSSNSDHHFSPDSPAAGRDGHVSQLPVRYLAGPVLTQSGRREGGLRTARTLSFLQQRAAASPTRQTPVRVLRRTHCPVHLCPDRLSMEWTFPWVRYVCVLRWQSVCR